MELDPLANLFSVGNIGLHQTKILALTQSGRTMCTTARARLATKKNGGITAPAAPGLLLSAIRSPIKFLVLIFWVKMQGQANESA